VIGRHDYLPDELTFFVRATEAEHIVPAKLGKIVRSEEQWRGLLTPEQYRGVRRNSGTIGE
jgi:hypothetical protein